MSNEHLNDYRLVARRLVPTEAHLLCGCLRAAGIAAVVADDGHVQVNFLLAPALGGTRVLVPEAELETARAVLAAYERGEFALSDSTDVGPAPVE